MGQNLSKIMTLYALKLQETHPPCPPNLHLHLISVIPANNIQTYDNNSFFDTNSELRNTESPTRSLGVR